MNETIAMIDRLVALDKEFALVTLRQLLGEAKREANADAVSTVRAIIRDVELYGHVNWPADLESETA